MCSPCIKIITGNKYNLVSADKIWFISHYTGIYQFHRMLCFQFFIMHALHNSDAKIISHLQNIFYIPLVFPKYYIISLSGDDCLKMKEASIQNSHHWNFHLRLNLAFLQKKKNTDARRKEKAAASRAHLRFPASRDWSWWRLQLPRSQQRKWRCAGMERMCAAKVEGGKDNGMMRL